MADRPQTACFHQEAVTARGKLDNGDGRLQRVKATVGASCGKPLRGGKCPKHGTDIKPRKALGS